MTMVQLLATLGPEGQLIIQYDASQLAALGLQEPPSQVDFREIPRARPSFVQAAGQLGDLGMDAAQWVREQRDEE